MQETAPSPAQFHIAEQYVREKENPMIKPNISRERFEIVYKDISGGSEPAFRFYILVAISTLIASFGLVADSTAVVIGAMLVAPLMTPIFGIALALVRSDAHLLRRAARAELLGVIAAVSMGFILGLLLGDFDPTREMLSRTQPTLFDLLVAVLAGTAGAYALVDEKISPALPGVAIATAIVPPLANSGLCLALGEVNGGLGSFLLFFANFLSILIVASGIFILSGMAKRYGTSVKSSDVVRRFGLPVIAFILIAAFLGKSLADIYEKRRLDKIIRNTLIELTSQMPATYLGAIQNYTENGTVYVMASVHSPAIFTSTKVERMQNTLSDRTGMPSELLINCVLSNNISAHGAVNTVLTPRLDGTFVKSSENKSLQDIARAEQVIREYFDADRALNLIRVESVNIAQRKIMLAHILGFRQVQEDEVRMLEKHIRKVTGDNEIELVFSSFEKTLKNEQGIIRYGWIPGQMDTPEIRENINNIRADVAAAFTNDAIYDLININATYLDNTYQLLLELRGLNPYPKEVIKEMETRLSTSYDIQVNMYVWTRLEAVNSSDGPISLLALQQTFNKRQKENLPAEIPALLEASQQ